MTENTTAYRVRYRSKIVWLFEDVGGNIIVPQWYRVLNFAKNFWPYPWKIQPFPSLPLLNLIPLWMPPDRVLLPFAKRRIYKRLVQCDHLVDWVKMNLEVEFGSIVNKSIWNSNESDYTSEVKRMRFAHHDAEVWDRAKEMIAAFMMEGSAQLSEQHWLLKSTVLFGECHVVKVYECAWFKVSWVLQQMVYQ